jgi:hypothetical protein
MVEAMNPLDELARLRKEARALRKEHAAISRSRDAQEHKNGVLEKKVTAQADKIQAQDGRINELEAEIAELKSRLNHEVDKAKTYAGMIFKSNVRKQPAATGRGGKPGHPGNGRRNSTRIDREIDVCLTNCYGCNAPLKQTTSFDERIIEDIPTTQTVVTKYRIQRQWCIVCHKEVRAIPQGTIPGARFGINTLVLILCLKYRLRVPLEKIAELLETQHGLVITSQGIAELLHVTKTKFIKQYNDILTEVRNAPVKNADETGWRINGVNGWCWLFATPSAAFYTIEETRGKDVPQRLLGHDPTGVLVRDDCPSYFSLPMPQQSCWAHLLRVSHDAAEKDSASKEIQVLHRELACLFQELGAIIRTQFNKNKRRAAYATYTKRIKTITARMYQHDDAKAVQTRIANQNTNLITALLYHGVPLTNNHAERMIRPMVITRKISGGSQSDRGAATHAVNMSVMQTLALKGQSFLEGITEIIHAGNPRYALGNG